MLLFLLIVLSICSCIDASVVFVIDTSPEGLVYLLLVLIFAFIFATPILKFIYVIYIEKLVLRAKKEVDKLSAKLSERLSDAGRKVSEQMRV